MVAERDELRLEVARLRDRLLQSLAEGGADQAEAEKQVCTLADELDEANARTEKYKAVIEAANVNAGAMVNLLIAMANAGLPMPHPVVWPKEADHD
jgi:regulator of replication initiation timing